MLEGMRRGSTRVVGLRTWLIAAVSMAALIVPGIAAGAASAETTWLCKPGIANNPCESSLTTTVVAANGSSTVVNPKDAVNPPIDCFYVYPTVSSQLTVNANLEIDPEETQIAIDQASHFSQTCKVYAPMYPQITLAALNTPGAVTPEASATAYIGVAEAFEEYLEKYNNGRGVILIGHSQGSLVLEQLLKEQFDPSTATGAALRHLLVGADLLGGNIVVPKGKTVGAEFKNIPLCSFVGQTHCLTAYSSFLKEPPNPSYFGRVESPLLSATGAGPSAEEVANDEIACVNPSVFGQGPYTGPLFREESTTPFPGLLGEFVKAPKASTQWVSYPLQYTGTCEHANSASWLQLTAAGGPKDTRPPIEEVLGPLWGTHLEDVNVATGNLVANSEIQSLVYSVNH
jgi:hypothetical protein